jgi:arylsulfatase A
MMPLPRILAAIVALLILAFPAPARPPNIVFILADDLGQRDLACYGSTFYETPHIDGLAKQGVRFTDAYAACNVCSPTRAAIMTGKYPARLHLTDWLPGRKDMPNQKLKKPDIQDHLSFDEVTIAQALKEAGYATGFFGKWHLGGPAHWPDKHGFDLNVAGCGLGHPPSYFSPYKIPTLPDGPKGEYVTDRLTDEAIKFIEANHDKPFFVYLPHYAVHNPQQAKSSDAAHWPKLSASARSCTASEWSNDSRSSRLTATGYSSALAQPRFSRCGRRAAATPT